jgi:putative ABC transport system permease protein
VLGIGSGMIAAETVGMPVEITPTSIAIAFGFATAIGVFFGYYPASKAAKLRPVEALRYE